MNLRTLQNAGGITPYKRPWNSGRRTPLLLTIWANHTEAHRRAMAEGDDSPLRAALYENALWQLLYQAGLVEPR